MNSSQQSTDTQLNGQCFSLWFWNMKVTLWTQTIKYLKNPYITTHTHVLEILLIKQSCNLIG